MDDEIGVVELKVEDLEQVSRSIWTNAQALERLVKVNIEEADRIRPRVRNIGLANPMLERRLMDVHP